MSFARKPSDLRRAAGAACYSVDFFDLVAEAPSVTCGLAFSSSLMNAASSTDFLSRRSKSITDVPSLSA